MLNQNSRPADFVLGSCPHCEKVVRIPVTAVTSQSRAQVRCPICDNSFELASVLENLIPSVEVVEYTRPVPIAVPETKTKTPGRINAIDTPELFHVAKSEHEPITQKKNGRFIVPELLSRGIKKKRKHSRRRSRSADDPRLAESLARLKENTSTTSLPGSSGSVERHRSENGSGRSRQSSRSESSERSEGSRSGKSRSSRKQSIKRIPAPSILKVRSWADFKEFLSACKSLLSFKLDAGKSPREGSSSRTEYIMIGLGALIAIPILHLMMWWLIGIDPLGLARPTNAIAPFLVPNEMKPVQSNEGISIEPAEPSKWMDMDSEAYHPAPARRSPDGKLPKPKLDPSAVHVDEY